MDVYSGVRWSAISKYGAQGMQFVISIVMARLLAPEYFGLMGMATVVTGFVKVFKDLGFNSVIIQRKEISDDLLSTLFWVNLGMCLLIAAIVLGISPVAAMMYDDPRVTPIIAVLAINFVWTGFTMIPSALLTRTMQFKKLAIREIGGVIASGIVGLSMAYYGYGVWALVGSSLASSFSQMILINLAVPYRPKFVWDHTGLRQSMSFGLNITGCNIFNYFARNADNFIIGIFLGPVALGYYSLAYKLMLLPRDSITQVVNRVLFPKLSKLQDNDKQFADNYLRACGAIALVTFPMMAGLAAIADPFVYVVLGEKWAPAIPLIYILAPVGALQSLSSTIGYIFLAKGRSDMLLAFSLATGIGLVASFLAGISWGLLGVATAYTFANMLIIPIAFQVAFRYSPQLSMRKLATTIGPHAFNSFAMSVAVSAFVYYSPYLQPREPLLLVVATGLGIVIYPVLLRLSPAPAISDVLQLLPGRLSKYAKAMLATGPLKHSTEHIT